MYIFLHVIYGLLLLQIMFEGDPLKMMCSLHGLGKQATTDQVISWKWEDRNPTHTFDNITQFQDVNVDNDTIER